MGSVSTKDLMAIAIADSRGGNAIVAAATIAADASEA